LTEDYIIFVEKSQELRKFGDRVRSLRIAKGFSQEKLAELSGLHRNYIGGIERGERNIALLNILRLSKALGISASQLLDEIE
jgi:transcriptional regulator with XRE-family HTH domain